MTRPSMLRLSALAASTLLFLAACGQKTETAAPAAGASGPGSAPAAAAPAHAGGGDVIRIGFTTDMSGVYSDVDGKGGAGAIQMALGLRGKINGYL